MTLGEPYNAGWWHSPVLWQQDGIVEGAQAAADPDWICCQLLILRVTLCKLLNLIYRIGGTNKICLLRLL